MNDTILTSGIAALGASPATAGFFAAGGIKNPPPPLQETDAVIDRRV
jgi:hypothetical protein